MPHLDPEKQQAVIRVLEEAGPKIEVAEAGVTLVDDKVIRAIVAEQRHGVSQGGVIPQKGPSQPVVKGTGWQGKPKPEDRTNQFRIFDAMVAAQVGGPNEPVK